MLQGMLKPKTQNMAPDVEDTRHADEQEFLRSSSESLNGLEKIRLEKFKIYMFRKKIAVPLGVVLTPVLGYIDYLLLALQSGKDDQFAGVTAMVLGGLYTWVITPKLQYTRSYKQKMLPEIARLFGNFSYVLNGKIDAGLMAGSKILPRYDRYTGEDYFEGVYQGVNIKFCEVKFMERRKSGKNSKYVTVFKGLAILLDMKGKRFYGHTVVDRDKGRILSWFKQKSSQLKPANLVDPEFEKIFDVYTSDQVEARYLIDPVMIERIKGLQAEYEGESLTAAFYENRMLILIQSKRNHFEPADIHIPATDPQSVLGLKREIGQILGVIDQLNLYDPVKAHQDAQLNS